MEADVFLGLGSNQGDRKGYLMRAIAAMESFVQIEQVSPIYASQPWGYTSSNGYYNLVVRGRSNLLPERLLDSMQTIEQQLGRVRSGNGYTDRTIDIDLLLYGDQIYESPTLLLPHPHLIHRNFVLAPLNDVGKNVVHPVFRKTVNELFVLSLDESKLTRVD